MSSNTKMARPNYKTKIKMICEYFNIDKSAAIYLYHRRRRSYPFKKQKDPNYLPWNQSIQNNLVKLMGRNTIDWSSQDFNEEQSMFDEHQMTESKTSIVFRNRKGPYSETLDTEETINDGWTIVIAKHKIANNKFCLRKMGLLPQTKTEKPEKYRRRKIHPKPVEKNIEKTDPK